MENLIPVEFTPWTAVKSYQGLGYVVTRIVYGKKGKLYSDIANCFDTHDSAVDRANAFNDYEHKTGEIWK